MTGYRWAAIAAGPWGAGIGALIGVSIYLAGNADYRAQGGWPAFAYLLGVGIVLGAASAGAAVIGGCCGIAWVNRQPGRPGSRPIVAGSIGAATATSGLWLAIGLVTAVLTSDGTTWIGFGVLLAVVAGTTAAICSTVLLRVADRNSTHRKPL